MKLQQFLRDVSRETLDNLDRYEAHVRRWTPKINLVSKSTLSDFQTRHTLDSAQIFELAAPGQTTWLDFGSGAGLPGLIVAILSQEICPDRGVELIEADQRKTAFLRTVIRDLSLNAKVTNARIETLEPRNADVVSARALAPLSTLLSFASKHLAKDGTALLHKGKSWHEEVESARQNWHFDYEKHTSIIDPQSVVLKIRNIRHV